MTKPALLIVGLDGATWDVMQPLAAAGKLPNIARLMANGAWGPLESTIPPLTPSGWTSFMTGANPGKHGLYDFIECEPDGYGMHYTNAGTRRVESLWRILNRHALSAGVINVPWTYPPEPIDGYMISGLDTPDAASAFVHPPELKQDIAALEGGWPMDPRHLGYMHTDERRQEVLDQIIENEARRTRIAKRLMRERPTDVVAIVFTATDTVQHYFWHYADRSHHLHDPAGAARFGAAIERVYCEMDRNIGELLAAVSADTRVVLASDHGAGKSPEYSICLNQFLAQIGVLRFKSSPGDAGRRLAPLVRKADAWLRGRLTPRQKALLAKYLPRLRERWEAQYSSYAQIDFAASKAFCNEVLSFPPPIWINVKGQRPSGIVEPGREYEELVGYIVSRLAELRHPQTGQRLIKRAYRKSEIYAGPLLASAPDITLSWWEEDAFLSRPTSAERLDGPLVTRAETAAEKKSVWTGTHRLQGIFLLSAPGKVRRLTRAQPARIVDLAPTMLHLLGLPVPQALDGRVLLETLEEQYLSQHPAALENADASPAAASAAHEYTDEEAAKITKKLKELGYIE